MFTLKYEEIGEHNIIEHKFEFSTKKEAEAKVCELARKSWPGHSMTVEQGIEPEFIQEVIWPVACAIEEGNADLVIEHWPDITITDYGYGEVAEIFTITEHA